MISDARNDSRRERQPLAIVGVGCRFPGGVVDVESYWDLLANGRSGIIEVPENRWNREHYYHPNRSIPGRMVTKWGGFVDNLDQFDARFWGISPREALRMDPQQRWLLEVSWEALEDAGVAPQQLRGTNTGVFVGIASNDYAGLQMPNWDATDVHTNSGSTLSIASNRISYLFDFKGPSISVDTACSSALVAMSQACHSIWSGECDAVLTGGVNALITPHASVGFSKASMLSPSGRCFAFDERADGYVRGEGAAMVYIKPLDCAIADNDPIYAVVRAAVVNQDGHTSSMTVPSVEGQSEMLRQAYRDAGIEPGHVVYMEAHGTGTPVGDPIEATALGEVLSEGRPEGRCLVGSVKTNIGHLESGSGVAGLVKAALVLHHDTVPASLNFENPNPNIPFDRLRLEVVTRQQPLPHHDGHAPVTAVNSFGFGGTNAHIVLEAAPRRRDAVRFGGNGRDGNGREGNGRDGSRSRETSDEVARNRSLATPATSEHGGNGRFGADRPYVLPISARDQEALGSYVRAYRDFLADDSQPMADVCFSAGERKEHHGQRLVVTGRNATQMRVRLAGWLTDPSQAEGVVAGKSSAETGAIVFVFTGQGAQWWAMGRQLFDREPIFRRTLERIDGMLQPLAGWSLVDEMMRSASEDESNIHNTSIAQPAIFALQVGLAELWKSWGITPSKVIGHSVGEVAAACYAGIYTLQDAVKIIYHRSRLQDSAGGDGRMLAAGISAAQAREAIGELSDCVAVAVINSPNLLTLAGDHEPLKQIAARLEEAGRFTRWLPINYAFHTHHMDGIKDELLEALADIQPQPGRIPFISTVIGSLLQGEKLDAMYWWRNVRNPVLFAPAMSNLVQAGERLFLELGPHPALESAINEILAEQGKRGAIFHSLKRKTDESEQILSNLGGLHTTGTHIDWAAVNQSGGHFVRLPRYPWHYETFWLESDEMARERLGAPPHPLLGRRLTAATPTWQFQLDPRLFTWLEDHRIWDSIILPAAGYGEIGLAVARELFPDEPHVIEELQSKKGLFISEDKVPTVQVEFDERDKSFRVYSSTAGTDDWELNAQGRLVSFAASDVDDADLAKIREPLTGTVTHQEFYDEFTNEGYQFGPNFRHVQNLWRVQGEALGEIVVPEGVRETVDEFHFHPSVLDACFQLSKAVQIIEEDDSPDFYLPASIRRIHLYRDKPPTRLWAHANLLSDDGESIVTDILVYDDEGRRVADILGFRVERVDQNQSGDDDVENCFYQFHWQPCRLRGSGLEGSCQFPSSTDVVAAADGAIEEIYERYGLAGYYNDFRPRSERIVHQLIQNACVKLGWPWRVGEQFTLDDLVRQLGIVEQHRRLAHAEMRALEAAGVLRDIGEDHWEVAKAPAAVDVDADLDALAAEYPQFATELELLRVTGPHLASVLSGEADAMELLFPAGSAERLENFYANGAGFPTYNQLIQVAVARATASLPPRRVLRVLEVGAGTGSLTREVLSVLPPDRTEYLFTDIGPAFLTAAQKQFSEFPFVEYQIFDAEKSPQEQGIQPHSFDLVLATNVLHATTDLKRTLANVQSCLDSGGMLIFLENVRRRAVWDNIFGLLKGWWHFTDTDLRRESALLERHEWESLLIECGFDDVSSFVNTPHDEEAEQAILTSFGPRVIADTDDADSDDGRQPASCHLIFADRGGIADALADRIREAGSRPICVRVGDEFSCESEDQFTVAPDSEDDLRQVLAEVADADVPLEGIVHCWGLDCPHTGELQAHSLEATQQTGVLSAMRLTHVLADHEWPRDDTKNGPPRIHLVTREIHCVVDDDRSSGLASSAMVGFARVANNEHPQFRWTLIDLDGKGVRNLLCDAPGTDRTLVGPSRKKVPDTFSDAFSDAVQDLFHEITQGDDELEVAWRDGRRYVNRLQRVRADELPRQRKGGFAPDGQLIPYRLQTDRPGVLTNLSLNETRRRDPGPDEIEVRVLSGGINFRDVMKALGMYPGNPVDLLWFGDDFSGIVERVGENVGSLKPGDEVAGMAPYCFRAYCTVDSRMVFKKPPHMSFEEAATLPTVFLTSHYALNHLAQMQPGEKVLIHAGTGGVGQAAIQIAQHAGLEIFATAGTPEKRQMLCDQGVPHVMNSRTLEFADQVMEITAGRGVDAVLNSLAGEFIPKSFSVLAPFGRFLEIGKMDVYSNSRIGMESLKNNISYFVIDLAQHLEKKPAFVASMFAELSDRFASGDYKPLPHKVFPITDVTEAFRYMAQGKHVGKNVLSFQVDELSLGPCTEDEHLFRDDATYLITGGAGGFGLELARWMAGHGARHVVLMSRSGPRDDDSRATIRQLRDNGANIVDARGDVTNSGDVDRVVRQIQDELPPLKGVVHGAMVLDDEFLVNLDSERFNSVLHPKILGAWNLHAATRDLPLEHFVCFSSFSAVIGGTKQSNYNAGNSFLDALAFHRRALGLPALTYNWGSLLGAGFVERNRKTAEYLDKLGMKAFTIEEALEVFGRMMLLDPTQIGASRMDWQSVSRLSPMVARSNTFAELTREADTNEGGGAIQTRILSAAPDQRLTLLEDFLTEQVAGVFGVEPAKVDRESPLTSLGLDSLMSIDLMNRVESELGLSIPVGNVLRGPNIKELSQTLAGMMGDASGGPQSGDAAGGADNTALVPLEKTTEAQAEFPLTEGQQALWFLYRLAPDSSAYNLTFSARYRPHVDIEAMKKAFASLFRQHPMLDVVFSDAGGEPVQRLRRGGTIDFREHDATQLDQQEVNALLVEHANQPFDLENGPVVRLDLFRTEDGHIGLLCMHHIISDAWSVTVLNKDLVESYFTYKAGRSPQFSEQSFTYADFVAWERRHLESDAGKRMGEYWRRHVDGAPQQIDLPTDRPQPPIPTFRGGTRGFELDDELTRDVLQLAAEQNVTLFTLLLSAYEVLLHGYSNQQDFLVGCPLAGRNHRELHDTVGYFVNPVPLRSRVDDDPTFLEFLGRNREHVTGALENQHYPLKRLVRELDVTRDSSRSPLFQVAFSMERIPGFDEQGIAVFLIGQGGYKFYLGDLQIETVDVILRQAQFEILLVVEEAGGNIYGCWQYNRDLFDPETIERLNELYTQVLQEILRNPLQRISQFDVSPERPADSETDLVLRQQRQAWNQTDTPLDSDLLVHERIEEQAARTPDEVAVVCDEHRLTYREMNERANRLAHYLRSAGVGPDVRVGICMKRCTDLIVAIQGVLKAGGAYVPLDATYPQQRLQTIADSAGMSIVLTHDVHRERLSEHCGRPVCLDTDWAAIAEHSAENPEPLAGRSNLIYVIYTSGSTGQPKGAGVYHRGFANLVEWFLRDFQITSSDRSLVITSHGFDLTQKNLYAALMVGGQVHLTTCDDYDPNHVLREVDDGRITLLNCTPSHFYPLVDDSDPRRLAMLDSVRTVFLGGEPIDMAKLAAWRSREGFSTELVNTYGPTECTDICSFYRVSPTSDETVIPVGFPIYNVQTWVLDENTAPVPVGVTGELCISGAGVGIGYINDADMTATSFVPDPFSSDEASLLYRTGDMCRYRDDGAIEFVGRADHQIKIRGFRVELGEIEATLKRHPAVTEAVVVASENGAGHKRLIGYVTAEVESPESSVESPQPSTLSPQLSAFMRQHLPDHMVPSVLTVLDQFPLTPHGKIDRLRLPAPDSSRRATAADIVPPRDDVEMQLARIWEELLDVHPVGVTDDFFELGGHSLLAVQLMNRLEKQFGRGLPLTALFQGTTIEALAALVRQPVAPSEWSPLVAIRPDGSRPPLFCIHPAGGNVLCYYELARNVDDDQPVYGLQARGTDGSQPPHDNLNDMVADYLEAVRGLQPEGPYHLLGWSSGGVVAYEMARQLREQGEQIALLALLDSRTPSSLPDLNVDDDVGILCELATFLNRFFGAELNVSCKELAPLEPRERLRTMLLQARQQNVIPEDMDIEHLEHFVTVCRANLRVLTEFPAVPCDAPVHLFRAADESRAKDRENSDLGWEQLLNGQLEVHVVPGNHVTMLTRQNAGQLCELLTACMRQTSQELRVES